MLPSSAVLLFNNRSYHSSHTIGFFDYLMNAFDEFNVWQNFSSLVCAPSNETIDKMLNHQLAGNDLLRTKLARLRFMLHFSARRSLYCRGLRQPVRNYTKFVIYFLQGFCINKFKARLLRERERAREWRIVSISTDSELLGCQLSL